MEEYDDPLLVVMSLGPLGVGFGYLADERGSKQKLSEIECDAEELFPVAHRPPLRGV